MIDSTSFWALAGTTVTLRIVDNSEFFDFDSKISCEYFWINSINSSNRSWDGDEESDSWSCRFDGNTNNFFSSLEFGFGNVNIINSFIIDLGDPFDILDVVQFKSISPISSI